MSFPGWLVFAFITGILVNLIEIGSKVIVVGTKNKTTDIFRLESMYQSGAVFGPITCGALTLHWDIEAALVTWAILNIIGILLTSKIKIPSFEKISGRAFDNVRKRKTDF